MAIIVSGAAAARASTTRTVAVIVQARAHAGGDARQAVLAAGGRIGTRLAIINGFAARVPARAAAGLARHPAIRAVTPDTTVQMAGSGSGGNAPAAGGSSARDVFREAIRSHDLTKAAKVDGAGVTVALIDTGVSEVGDLKGRLLPVVDDRTGRSAPCLNLSGDDTCADNFGHGTFMAGLIAGSGNASGGRFAGVAPKANLVSIKIAGRSGAADVSNVLAAIEWAVSFKDRYGIKVLNLSLGTDSRASYRTDPLNFAVERAWAAGITVVVSASNRGPAAGTISKPGDDPFVITVGAVDDTGTPFAGDDRLPAFTGRGPTAGDGITKPDVVAPGAHLISTNAPGSAIDDQFPAPAPLAPAYRRGSGTSMATAVVSGAVALMLAADPTMTPDRVKFALTSTAVPVASDDVQAIGAGLVDVYDAALFAPDGLANAGVVRASLFGDLTDLDTTRGTVRTTADDPFATVVRGTLTAQLLTWDARRYATSDWNAPSWYGSSWYGSSWYGSSWYGSSWFGSSWFGSSWYGQTDGSSWYGSSWYGSSWYGAWG